VPHQLHTDDRVTALKWRTVADHAVVEVVQLAGCASGEGQPEPAVNLPVDDARVGVVVR
jgi:hypothetical protein